MNMKIIAFIVGILLAVSFVSAEYLSDKEAQKLYDEAVAALAQTPPDTDKARENLNRITSSDTDTSDVSGSLMLAVSRKQIDLGQLDIGDITAQQNQQQQQQNPAGAPDTVTGVPITLGPDGNANSKTLKSGRKIYITIDGQQQLVTIVNAQIEGDNGIIVYIDPKTNTPKTISLAKLIEQGGRFQNANAATGAPPGGPDKMTVGEKDFDVIDPVKDKKEWRALMNTLLGGEYSDDDLANAQFARDNNGNVYIRRGDQEPQLTNYIYTGSQFVHAPNINDDTWDETSEDFQDTYGERGDIRVDQTTGEVYSRRNNNSRWRRSTLNYRVIEGLGDVTPASSHELGGDYTTMVQKRDDEGNYNYYYYDSDTKKWTQVTVTQDLIDSATARFGEDWVDENIEGKTLTDRQIMELVYNRQSDIRFWNTFFEGAETLLWQTVEEKWNEQWGWNNFTGENWQWLEDTFWQTEKWEEAICNGSFENDIPDSVQVGHAEYGPRLTLHLEASKQDFPDNTTLHTVSWAAAPIEGEMNYTVCYSLSELCYNTSAFSELPHNALVETPNVDTGFVTDYFPTNLSFDYVMISYSREVDGDVVEVDIFERPIVAE
jgi:hypothetical protein